MTNGDTPPLGDIAPDEFRRQARRVLQWIGDYLEHPERFPVVPRVAPGDIAETILWCTNRPAHVDIQELVIFPTAQASVGLVKRE